MIPQLVKQLWSLLNRRERWQLAILTVALVVRAGVEVLGVASIMPFMSVVADPGIVQTNPYLAGIYDALGFTSVTAFLTAMGAAVVIFLFVANSFSAAALYGMLRFSWGMHHRLSVRLLRGYLSQPYGFFVQRNSASLSKTILSEVQQVVEGVLTPMLNIVARLLVSVALVILLIVLDPMLALAVVLVLGGAYGSLYGLIKAKQRRLGRDSVSANEDRFRAVNEALGGIKDVKVLQRERAFSGAFAPASWTFSKAKASNYALSQVPRYLIEAIAFGGIVLIVLYYLKAEQGVAEILPVISLYAFAGYRLVPEMQQLFAGVAQIRFNWAALDCVVQDITDFPAVASDEASPALPFRDAISFEQVSFRYPRTISPALDKISLRIERNQSVGLVGASGSGKTTLVDLLLGLYEPDEGRILVDGTPLERRAINAWRRQVGYVPQHIFLIDSTVSENIAFGLRGKEVDPAAVERAARVANLHDFIMTLPDGYATVVGERGVRLSGGQRQRVGIARALYLDPEVLIMDEATSALDNKTERSFVDAIEALKSDRTVVVVAHRLSTVRRCDTIFVLAGGKVVGEGSYDVLLETNKEFQAVAL